MTETESATPPGSRAALRARLEQRRPEIVQALLTRVYGIADPSEVSDTSYVSGFRTAASAALDFALHVLVEPEVRAPPVPPALLSQARLAARNGVPLDTVLRRYMAGQAILLDFLVEQVQREEALAAAGLRRLLALSSSALDHLLASVSDEYRREEETRGDHSAERRLAVRVERLLAGEPLGTGEVDYDFDAHHVAVVGHGPDASVTIRTLPAALDCRLLHVTRGDGVTWAWLGTRRRLDPAGIMRRLVSIHGSSAVAIGEPGSGVSGWRRSHRQAEAARLVLHHRQEGPVRYAEVALLASMLQDDLLRSSLYELYLEPLALERDGGAAFRATLRAYFEADRNISSAASALKVDRRTVANRLRAIEGKLPRPLGSALPDIEAALNLERCQPPDRER
ncbi:MAG TPA: helix-turn-helix domain-containing protein [Solirubrobacterales bacterium]|jgi:hypothetical protein|nr:helix-turn-helix domain-containing protein [Solirubrobacterales bacterium]